MTRPIVLTVLIGLVATPALAQCAGGICAGPAGYPLGAAGTELPFAHTLPRAPIATNPTLPRYLAASTVRVFNQQGPARSLGSGAIVASGTGATLVVTCGHLFREGVGRVVVVTPDNRAHAARLLDADLAWDVAVLSIPAIESPALPVAFSPPTVGDGLTYGGYGPQGRLAFGSGRLVSYVRMQHTPTADTLQLTGAARQGDSGGPIVNASGELVGLIVGTDGRVVIGPSCRPISRFLARFRSLLGQGTGDRGQGAANEEAPPEDFANPVRPGADDTEQPRAQSPLPPVIQVPAHRKTPNPRPETPSPQFEDPKSEILNLKSEILTALLPVVLAALGISVPPTSVFVALRVARCLARRSLRRRRRRRRRRDKSEQTNDKQTANDQRPTTCSPPSVELERRLNDDYARELASVFAYGGQSPLQDATLGREFSREIDRAAQSSDAKMADWAQDVRDRVLRRFHRIHGWRPSPAEPAE